MEKINGHPSEAGRHLTETLTRCRGINLVEVETDILLDLARLRLVTANREEALKLAHDARTITERSGYVLQGADVQYFQLDFLKKIWLDQRIGGTFQKGDRPPRVPCP